MAEPASDLEELPPRSRLDFPVVGIGASAGGLKALRALFGAVPPDSGMAFVVILHLSPEHESHVAELLRNVTTVPVNQVTAPVQIERNRIYVISPKSHLVMRDGHLEPAPRTTRHGGPMTIDVFFQTLAEAHKRCAFGIVLSGTGSDGTKGSIALKTQGGVMLVQDPEDAEFDAMPRNAIASGAADFVLAANEMPAKLATVWANAAEIRLPPHDDQEAAQDQTSQAEEALRDVLALTKARTRNDFSQYKRPTLLRRIERRMQVNQVRDLPSYRDYVREHPAESRSLLRDLLISVTSFFRDEAVFDSLAQTIIPTLFAEAGTTRPVRVWVVGCATGEEAYSIAMLLAEHAATLETPAEVSLFATDIDEQALTFARAAIYPESIRDHVSAERLKRFFEREPNGYRVQRPIRESVMFATHNVLQDAPFSRLDLVSCRNLLIYVDRDAQRRVLDLLHFSLRPEGYLLLGRSEAVEKGDGFDVIEASNRIFRQRARVRRGFSVIPRSPAPQSANASLAELPRQRVSYGDLHQQLLEHYGPPSVVVDERYDLVHLSESAGRYLKFGPGVPSVNLLDIVPQPLRFELRTALDQAIQSMQAVERTDLPLGSDDESLHVDVTVHPVRDRTSQTTFALVLFDQVSQAREPLAKDVPPDAGSPTVRRLKDRLRETETRLRALSEEYQVHDEEAKASNEELQAINEELRATSEELETGKEELQSVNEELRTVNLELKQRIEEATRLSDDLTNFINATDIAVLFVDKELRLMRFTPAARALFNVIEADIGRPLLDITHRLDDDALEINLREVVGTSNSVEREVRGSDGRSFQMRVLPYRSADNRAAGAVLTFFDISERKRAEEAVRRSEAWLALMLESIRDYAMIRLDASGRVVSWNPAAVEIFGYAEQEVLGRRFDVLFTHEDQASGVPRQTLATARETGRAKGERWMLRKDGSRFYASGVTAPISASEAFGYVTLLRNLTDEQVEHQRLLQSERDGRLAAQDAARVREQFLATLSHELRNPLALILMQSELLMRAPELRDSQRLVNAAGIIHQMVEAQSQLVNDMLDVSRARAGKLALDRQLVPLSLVIADSIGALRLEAEQNAIALELDITTEPLIVEADAVRVRQIAWNLLSNALKFTPRGGRVGVRLARENGFARLDVEDNGQGIAPEVLPRIFEWFSQGESGSTRRQGGMGIGLALVKQLTELQGGRVDAHSEGIGKGARFTVCLPLQSTMLQRQPLASMPTQQPAGRLAGVRILVIDDVVDSADAMGQLLALEGAAIATENSARAAIKRAQREKFDVIVSDIAMPGMDGLTMLRQIRANPLNAATPAIAHSGYGGREDTERSKAAGFQLHVTKPVGVEELIAAIESARGMT